MMLLQLNASLMPDDRIYFSGVGRVYRKLTAYVKKKI